MLLECWTCSKRALAAYALSAAAAAVLTVLLQATLSYRTALAAAAKFELTLRKQSH
jgi:hypothetical protein